MRAFGEYRREESDSQTKETARLQEQTQEVWGKEARGSDILSVKAYIGSLPEGQRGIEFSTDIKPNRTSSPLHARWYYGHDVGVELRPKGKDDYACIAAEVRNCQK